MIDKSMVLLGRVKKDLSTWVEEKGFKVSVENWWRR